MIHRLIYYWFVLIIHTAFLCSCNRPCFTWKIQDEKLELICRITGFSHPVLIIDNQGKLYAYCTFTTKDYNCIPFSRPGLIEVDFSKKYIMIKEIKMDANMSGIWVCSQDNMRLTTEVSLTKGIVDSTEICFTGTVLITEGHNMKHVLNCFSCREPDHRNVEFLIDGRTEDSITYHETGNCTHYKGECHPDECSCNGNLFQRTFQVESKNKSISYTCDMVFTDSLTNAKFSKLVSVVFDGEGFYNETESTTIIKPAEKIINDTLTSDDGKENVTDDFFIYLLIGVSFAVIMVISILILIIRGRCLYYKRRKATEHKKRRMKETGDSIALVDNGAFEQIPSGSDTMNPVFCYPCERQFKQSASVYFCIDCEEAHCRVCSANHKILKQTTHHKYHSMNIVSQNALLILTCVYHDKMKFQYYCIRHDVICCTECKTREHEEGCILLKLDSDLEKVLESHDQISFGLQLDKCIKHLKSIGKYLYHADKQDAQEQISDLQDSNYNSNTINVITTKQNTYALKIEQLISFMSEQRDVLYFIKKHGSERQLFIVKHYLNQQINEIYTTVLEVLHRTKIPNVNALQNNSVKPVTMTDIIFKELKDISL